LLDERAFLWGDPLDGLAAEVVWWEEGGKSGGDDDGSLSDALLVMNKHVRS
jgi:hypothetical protein